MLGTANMLIIFQWSSVYYYVQKGLHGYKSNVGKVDQSLLAIMQHSLL